MQFLVQGHGLSKFLMPAANMPAADMVLVSLVTITLFFLLKLIAFTDFVHYA